MNTVMDFIRDRPGAGIVVCCGSGGVGKTTISATIGLQAALSGRKTLVLTIDPARRLADTLGISAFGHEAQRIDPQRFESLGIRPKGELFAMMLDTKRTFDQIVAKYASEQMQTKILENRYYQHLSSTLAGSHEYMAMEKLYEIHQRQEYDLIVLDTPPSRRALDFLEAPERLADLLSHNFFWKIFRPYLSAGRKGFQMFNFVATPVLRVLSQVMGTQVLRDIADFFNLWDDVLFEGFRQRSRDAKQLLTGPDAFFLAITSPMRIPLQEALFLYKKLSTLNVPFGGFIVNRVHPTYEISGDRQRMFDGYSEFNPALREKLITNFYNFRKLGKSDENMIAELRTKVQPDIPIWCIPLFEMDVYDFQGLIRVGELLFADC